MMSLLPISPTCGVIVEKNEEGEKACGEPATQLVSMVDPDTKTKVTAILLVCDKHDHDLETGKELIFLSDDQKDHIMVKYKVEGVEK